MFQMPKGNQARDAISSLVIMVVCAIGVSQTVDYPDRAAAWPLWMWSLLALLSVALLFNSLRAPVGASDKTGETAGKADPGAGKSKGRRIATNIALVIGFVSFVPVLGFFTAGIIYLCFHMYYLGIRPIWKIFAVAVGTLIVFWCIFEYFLGVIVPHGILF